MHASTSGTLIILTATISTIHFNTITIHISADNAMTYGTPKRECAVLLSPAPTNLYWQMDDFHVTEEASPVTNEVMTDGCDLERKWTSCFVNY
jgi:hypothetical protein